MSFTVNFQKPEPAPPPSRPVDPSRMNSDERSSARWQVGFVAWVVGLPSLIAIAFVGIVGLWYAWQFTADAQTWLALSAGLIAVTLFGAGMPIAWGLTRDIQPVAAKAAFVFWLACVTMNFGIMAHFARHEPEALVPSAAIARDMPGDEARELDMEIGWRREALAGFDEDLAPGAPKRRRDEASTPEAQGRRAKLQGELRKLEITRYGAAVTEAAPLRSGSKPGLDLAGVALLMIAGSAVGLAISASSLAAILTEKAATVRLEAEAAPQPAPLPLAVYHPGESADGFEHWALSCVSKLNGAPPLQTGDAHAHYLNFCARNDFQATLPNQEFGRRLRAWMMNTFGIDGRHSGSAGGTVYDGVTLAPLSPSIAAQAMNGGA